MCYPATLYIGIVEVHRCSRQYILKEYWTIQTMVMREWLVGH